MSMFTKKKKKAPVSGIDMSMFTTPKPVEEPEKVESVVTRKPLLPKSEGLGFSSAIKTDIYPEFRQGQAEEAVTSESLTQARRFPIAKDRVEPKIDPSLPFDIQEQSRELEKLTPVIKQAETSKILKDREKVKKAEQFTEEIDYINRIAMKQPVRDLGKWKVARTYDEYRSDTKGFRPPREGDPEYDTYIRSYELDTARDVPFQTGLVKEFGSGVGEKLGKVFDPKEESELFTGVRALKGAEETAQEYSPGKFAGGKLTGKMTKSLAMYTAAGGILDKLGIKAGEKLLGQQGVALLLDTLVQAPFEIAEFVSNDKSASEDVQQFVLNRALDVAFNAGFSALGVGFKNFGKMLKSENKQVREAAETMLDSATPAQKQTIQQELGLQADAVTKDIQPEPLLKQATDTVEPLIKQADTVQPLLKETPDVIKQADAVQPATRETVAEPLLKTEGEGALKERGFSQNIRTDEAIAKEANASFDKDPEFYRQLENKTTLERAQARFDRGYETALKDFDSTKSEFKADNVVLSKMLANEAARIGDLDTMRRVLSETADTLTTAGQYSQAAKILRDSNDPATVVAYFNRELKKLNEQGLKRYGTLKNKLIGKGQKGWKNIELTDNELKELTKFTAETTDADKKVVFEKLFDSISERIPSTKREKFDAWRRIAMLTNPKTHMRNILGNTLMAGVKKVADTIAVGGEKFIPKLERTKSVFKSNEVKQAASNYWDANQKQLSEGSRWEIFGVKSPFAEKKVFDVPVTSKVLPKTKTAINKSLEAANNFSMATLNNEDIFFLKRHFVGDLAGFMQARGLKEPTQEAVDYALRRAQEATFRQQNALASIITEGKKSRYGFLVEAAIPFSKTPANIAQTGIDYSPLGVVKAIGQLAQNQKPAEFIETMSKGLTGTGLSTLGFYMAYNGMARGEYRRDKEEEALFGRAGILPNSIQLKNGSYTIDWAQPAAIPYFMGVAFAEEIKKKDDKNLGEKMLGGSIKGVSTILKQTMLSGITDLLGSYDEEGIVENIASLPLNYLSQALPTVGGQLARSMDPVKRERDYSGLIPTFQSQTQSKIPGLSEKLPAKRGLLGEELKYGEGIPNAIQQFLSPGYFAKKQDDPLTNELMRLYNEVGPDFLPRAKVKDFTENKVKYTLTTQEISDFQKIMGQYTERKLTTLFKSDRYKKLNIKEKAKAVRDINDEGYEKAKAAIAKRREK